MTVYAIKTEPEAAGGEVRSRIESLMRSASLLMQQDKYTSAAEKLQEALRLAPSHVECLAGLAICLAEEGGRFVSAERLARKAAQIAPRNASVHLALGRVYRLGGRYESARSHLQQAARFAPRDRRIQAELDLLDRPREPVISDLPADHLLNRRLGQLRDILSRRLALPFERSN